MSDRFPAIPEPVPTLDDLYNTVLALKQAVEILTKQRGDQDTQAVTFGDLSASYVDNDRFAELGGDVSSVLESVAALEAAVAALPSFPLGITDGGTGQTSASAAFGALKQAATESETGVVELATEAEVLAASDASLVAPLDSLVHHPGVAKACGYVSEDAGNYTLEESYGVDSVAGQGSSICRVTLSREMANALYTVIVTGQSDGHDAVVVAITTTTFDIQGRDVRSTPEDEDGPFAFAVFGELA